MNCTDGAIEMRRVNATSVMNITAAPVLGSYLSHLGKRHFGSHDEVVGRDGLRA